MESTFLCTLSALCLLTWASSSMTELQNVTQPTATSFAFMLDQYYNDTFKCISSFYISMSKIHPEHYCEWERVISFYSTLQFCIEREADFRNIAYPNMLSNSIFISVHKDFFANCTLLSDEIVDPPEHVLLALIFAPICIIPFLVTLVVFKSNTSKPQT